MPRVLIQCLLAVSACLIPVPYSWAVPVFTISGSGNVYSVQGDGLERVGGVDLTVHYDSSTLVNPRAALNGLFAGTLMQAKTNVAGVTRVLLLANRPGISGAGGVVTLTFDQVGGSQGCITAFSANAVTSGGDTIFPQSVKQTSECLLPREIEPLVPTTVTPPSQPPIVQPPVDQNAVPVAVAPATAEKPETSANSAGLTSAPGAVKPQGFVGGMLATVFQDQGKPVSAQESEGGRSRDVPPEIGAVTLPESVQGKVKDTQIKIAAGDMSAEKPGKNVLQADPKFISVLSLFRGFKGTRSKDKLVSLFSEARNSGVRQEPDIVISDGKNRVKVALTLMPTGRAPSYIISGGELVSFSSEKNTHIFEILPKQNALEVSVTVVVENDLIVIPLVVAPPLDIRFLPKGRSDEKSYGLFLQELNVKKGDVNGDGIRDYVDEYIYTANYLACNSPANASLKTQMGGK
jgi:hypothetical protein